MLLRRYSEDGTCFFLFSDLGRYGFLRLSNDTDKIVESLVHMDPVLSACLNILDLGRGGGREGGR